MGTNAGRAGLTEIGTVRGLPGRCQLAAPPRDPRVRAFCDALAEILATRAVAALRGGEQHPANGESKLQLRAQSSAPVIQLEDTTSDE